MTKRQRIEHKKANQVRKADILQRARTCKPEMVSYWVQTIGLIQDGKHTKR